MNPYSEEERLQAMLGACYAAVQTGFQHLALKDIINPPHPWFDAALARQIAIHILNVEFQVPRRRIVAMQARKRTSIAFAIQTVNARLDDPCFERAYERMALLASEMFTNQLKRDAA